jgi:hypothetical protein
VITNAVQPKPVKQRFRVARGAEVVGGIENLSNTEKNGLAARWRPRTYLAFEPEIIWQTPGKYNLHQTF